ncbi:MAG: hypothetical protein U0790_18865 [Isosphaeraceae bacterium]
MSRRNPGRSRWLLRLAALTLVFTRMGTDGPASERPRTIVLTKEDHDRTIEVRRGETVVLKLPISLPLTWTLEPVRKAIHEEKGYPKFEEIETSPADPGQPPNLGRGLLTVHRYVVTQEADATVRCEWFYCKFGKPASTRKWLEENHITPPDFRSDLKPSELREGMVYRVKLKVIPS